MDNNNELNESVLENLLIKIIKFEKAIINENKNINSTKNVKELKKIIEEEVNVDVD